MTAELRPSAADEAPAEAERPARGATGKTRPLDGFAALLALALCIVWGFNQVVAKIALSDVGPIAQTGIRSAIGVVCVIAFAKATGRRLFRIDGAEAAGVLAGALFTAEFIALYESLRWTTAARATVFIYATPLFVALGAVFRAKSQIVKRRRDWRGTPGRRRL